MLKIAFIDFYDENVKKNILKRYFTRIEYFQERQTVEDEIVDSPIVQELYFRDEFKEIRYPERLGEELLEHVQAQEMLQVPDIKENIDGELPIAQNCMESIHTIAESRIARNVTKTSQEIKTAYLEIENPEQNKETKKLEI